MCFHIKGDDTDHIFTKRNPFTSNFTKDGRRCNVNESIVNYIIHIRQDDFQSLNVKFKVKLEILRSKSNTDWTQYLPFYGEYG